MMIKKISENKKEIFFKLIKKNKNDLHFIYDIKLKKIYYTKKDFNLYDRISFDNIIIFNMISEYYNIDVKQLSKLIKDFLNE